MNRACREFALLGMWLAASCQSLAATDARLQVFGLPVQLAINEVSERTMRIELTRVDEQGNPRAGTPSTVLASFPSIEKFRSRELPGEKKLRVGKLRVAVKPNPLT